MTGPEHDSGDGGAGSRDSAGKRNTDGTDGTAGRETGGGWAEWARFRLDGDADIDTDQGVEPDSTPAEPGTEEVDTHEPGAPGAGRHRGRPGTHGVPDPRGPDSDAEEQVVAAEAVPVQSAVWPGAHSAAPPPEYPEDTGDTGFVRPYAITGGRTRANHHLELETLVSTRTAGLLAVPDQIEHQLIMEQCRTPQSVAEIASALGMPLGVARVLISDAADAGLVTVHRTVSGDEGAEAHLQLMERVLSGLRRL